jgi:hypothetical protein
MWKYVRVLDPYGIYDGLRPEEKQVGRGYFARAPGSGLWVDFGDLPEKTRKALWNMHKYNLAFPAGLAEAVAEAERLRGRKLPELISTEQVGEDQLRVKFDDGSEMTIEVYSKREGQLQ